jgi:hypothetical protein
MEDLLSSDGEADEGREREKRYEKKVKLFTTT